MKITKVSIAISALAFIVAAINLVYSIIYSTSIVPGAIILVVTIAIFVVNIVMQIAASKEEKLEAAALKAAADKLTAEEAKADEK